MIDPNEALRIVLDNTVALSGRAPEPADASAHAVTAETVRADRDIPAADLSRMDGYAVIAPLSAGVELRRVGEIPAGTLPDTPIEPGECCRIFTGAVLPPGANAVVKQEDVTAAQEGEIVRPNCDVAPGAYVTRRGSVAKKGTLLLPAGVPIGAAQAAVCAAVGATPACASAPRLAILCTGEEIVPRDAKPEPQQTRDINGPAIAAAARSIGAVAAPARIVPDDARQLTDELGGMLENTDVDAVVTIGGVSVGDYDLVPDALKAVGARVLLHGVSSRPGKPFLFALGPGGKPVFGLPGNVLSALVAFFGLVAPALRKMAGRPEPWDPTLPVRLESDVQGGPDRTYFVLARVRQKGGGEWVAEPLPPQHSADVATAATADGVITVPPADEGLPAGTVVQFRPWRPLW